MARAKKKQPLPIQFSIKMIPENKELKSIINKLLKAMAKEYTVMTQSPLVNKIPLTILFTSPNIMKAAGVCSQIKYSNGKMESTLMIDTKDYTSHQLDEILCHELTHYLQYCTDRFSDQRKSEYHQPDPEIDATGYRWDPAEIEAYGLQSHFANKYCNENSPDCVE